MHHMPPNLLSVSAPSQRFLSLSLSRSGTSEIPIERQDWEMTQEMDEVIGKGKGKLVVDPHLGAAEFSIQRHGLSYSILSPVYLEGTQHHRERDDRIPK